MIDEDVMNEAMDRSDAIHEVLKSSDELVIAALHAWYAWESAPLGLFTAVEQYIKSKENLQ